MNDNRRFKRINERVQIRYKILSLGSYPGKKVDTPAPSRSENISAGGVLFTSNTVLPLGTFLEIEMKLENEEFPLFLKARVVRLEELAPKMFDIGVAFKGLVEEDRETLQRYIESKAEKA